MPRRSESLAGVGPFSDFPDHPLFPVEEGEQNPQVTFIQITRHDRGVQKYGPVLRAEELTTTDELFEMYGGGHYELWARGPSKMKPDGPGNITKRRRFVLPGRSKPLSKDPTPEEIREIEGAYRGPGEAAPAAPAAPSSSAGAFGGDTNLLIAMMNMQQQNAQQFAQMMMTMLQSSKAESAEIAKSTAAASQQMTTMLLTLSSQNQASMMQFMSAIMAGKSGGPEEMAKYAKLLKDLGVAGIPGPKDDEAGEGGIGKIIEDAADFVQGIVQLKGSLPSPAGAGEAPPNGSPAPPGSAAAVAEGMLKKPQ